MISNEMYIAIARGLLEKTKTSNVPWKPGLTAQEYNQRLGQQMIIRPTPAREIESTEFMLQLDNSVIRLDFVSPPTTPDTVSLKFLDKNNHLAGSWEVQDGDKDWDLAFELYQEVSRKVLGLDKVFDDVQKYIGTN